MSKIKIEVEEHILESLVQILLNEREPFIRFTNGDEKDDAIECYKHTIDFVKNALEDILKNENIEYIKYQKPQMSIMKRGRNEPKKTPY